jgi:hypothetical protein
MAVLNVLSLPGSVQLPFRRSAAQARWLPNTDALRQESLRVLPLLAWGVNMGVRKPDHPQPLTQQLVRTERVGFEPKGTTAFEVDALLEDLRVTDPQGAATPFLRCCRCRAVQS